MKIAIISPLAERVPPKTYGGTERVVHALTEELVKMGHDVTLFASGDSITSANLVSVYPISLREAGLKDLYGFNPWTTLNIGLAYARQDEFDVIHDMMGSVSLPTANIAHTPVVMTEHGPIKRETRKLYRTLRNPYLVTISNSQREPAPDLNYIGTVYNGLPMEHYPFSNEHDGYLLYVGRFTMDKGVHFAIEVAQDLNMPLIMAAKLDPHRQAYFDQFIKPHLSKKIRWIGEVDEEERNKLYSRAKAFLHPCTWREPFGLTLIEAMACGCPVIAMNKGAIPEIIKDGETGFIVEDVDEMINAVEEIDTIDRKLCRKHVLKNFNAQKMAKEYEQIYKKILKIK
jgi:glycosyltransferase involved in cell wall biosynthesis